MEQEILLNAKKDSNNFVYKSSSNLIEEGVPKEAVLWVMFGMAERYISEGYEVKIETIKLEI